VTLRLFVWILALLLLAVGDAHAADDAVAAEFFRAARAAYERADYRAAALAFEEAYARSPKAPVLANAGLAWEAAGEPARAADDLDRSLAGTELAGEARKKAADHLTALEKKLGIVSVVAPEGERISAAHAVDRPIPARVHVPPGTLEVTLKRSDGKTLTERVTVQAGEVRRVAFEPVPEKREPETPRVDPAPAPPPPPAERPAEPPRLQRTLGWVCIGAGVVFAGLGTYFGLSGASANSDFNGSGHTDASLRDKAITYRTLANVSWIGAALAGIAGVTLLLTLPDGTRAAPQARLVPGNL
jgi:hypothetical protein